MKNKIAQVVVDLPVEGPFDYEIPSSFAVSPVPGHRVLVSFQTKTLIGYVVGLKEKSAFKRLKPIIAVLDKAPVLSPCLLDLARDFSQAYRCSLGEAIATFLPPYFKKTKNEIVFLSKEEQKKDLQPETLLIHDPSFKEFWPTLFERIHQTIAQGLGMIILVPETERIGLVLDQLKGAGITASISAFGKQGSDKRQAEDWTLIKEGKVNIVVGTRSAIFSPVSSLGLIVVLDENNFSYKQDQSPFYHARHVALMRAQKENAHLIFVARSMSLDLYYLKEKKKLNFIQIPLTDTPCVRQVIDMSNYKYGKSQMISIPLSHAIEKVLLEKGKILLLMNKKGFGSFGLCSKCQHILKCPRCDIPLTFLYESKQVACRYCNYHAPCPSVCPQCHGAYLNFTGMGIEKLESEVSRLFPAARVQTYAKENEVAPCDFDILIATQAVVRLDDSLRFHLTCIVQMDAELNRLDFQAGENTFSLLTHLHAMTIDKFCVQTHLRDNYCLKAFIDSKPDLFYKKELSLRRELTLPPFAHMAEIVVRSVRQDASLQQAELLHKVLTEKSIKGIEISSVQVLSLARLRDQYRFVIVAKGKSRKALVTLIGKALASVQKTSTVITTVNMIP